MEERPYAPYQPQQVDLLKVPLQDTPPSSSTNFSTQTVPSNVEKTVKCDLSVDDLESKGSQTIVDCNSVVSQQFVNVQVEKQQLELPKVESLQCIGTDAKPESVYTDTENDKRDYVFDWKQLKDGKKNPLKEATAQYLLVFGPQKQEDTGAQWWCEYNAHCLECAKCSQDVATQGHNALKKWVREAKCSWELEKKEKPQFDNDGLAVKEPPQKTQIDNVYKWMSKKEGRIGNKKPVLSSQHVAAWTFFNGVGVPDLITRARGLTAAKQVNVKQELGPLTEQELEDGKTGKIEYHQEFDFVIKESKSFFVTLKMNWGEPAKHHITTALFEVATAQGVDIFKQMKTETVQALATNIKFSMMPVKLGGFSWDKFIQIMARTSSIKHNPGLTKSFANSKVEWLENNHLFVGVDVWEATPASKTAKNALWWQKKLLPTLAETAGFKVVLTYHNTNDGTYVNLAEIDQKFSKKANKNALQDAMSCIPTIE